MGNIEKITKINQAKLDNKNYFQSLIESAYEVLLLNEEDAEKIQLGCMDILADLLYRKYGDMSSSVREESAEDIMESVVYTIGLRLKREQNPDEAILVLKRSNMNTLYLQGQEQIRGKLKEIEKFCDELRKTKIRCNNSFYIHVIDKSLPMFLSKYNYDTDARNISVLFDYPVMCPPNNFISVEYVREYAYALAMENRFCYLFGERQLFELFTDETVVSAQTNLFGIVLKTAISRLLIYGNMDNLKLSKDDRITLREIMHGKSQEEIRKLIITEFDDYANKGNLGKFIDLNYIKKCFGGLALEFYIFAKG